MMAFRPEAQTLLTVVAIVEAGREAWMATWREGFWPRLEGFRIWTRENEKREK